MPTFIIVDIEATGQTGGRQFSMISLGACVMGTPKHKFYEEIKPISPLYRNESMRIAAQGLECLQRFDHAHYRHDHPEFNPQGVLEVLQEVGTSPQLAMKKFHQWVLHASVGEPIFVSDYPSLDWSMVKYYFAITGLINPFSRCLDAGRLVMGGYAGSEIDCSMVEDIPDRRQPPHNALQDVLQINAILSQLLHHNTHINLERLAA